MHTALNRIWQAAVWNTPDAGNGGGVATPPPAPLTQNLPDAPPGELSPEAISDFVLAAEMGGLNEPIGGNEDFPDLPPTDPAPAGSAPPPAAPVSPAPLATPAVASPAVEVPPPAPQVQVPQVAQAQPGAAPVPQAAAPAPVATPAPATAPAAPTPVPETAPAAPQAAQVTVADPFAQLSQQLASASEQYITALAEREYAMSPEAHEAFLGGDTKSVSQLAAKIHFNAVNSVLASISKLMPVMVDGLMTVQRQTDERENRFWDANKHLNRSEHREMVKTVMQTYNQLNKQVDDAKRFRDVGLLVSQMYNIPLVAQATPAVSAVPAAPATPQVRTPGPLVRTVSPPGFAPASASPAPAQAAPPPAGVWESFVDFAVASERGAFDPQG